LSQLYTQNVTAHPDGGLVQTGRIDYSILFILIISVISLANAAALEQNPSTWMTRMDRIRVKAITQIVIKGVKELPSCRFEQPHALG
jgi:hypothetical protein